MREPSVRAQIITRRTYNRPLDMDNPVQFETWEQTVSRVIKHQEWLWERASPSPTYEANFDKRVELNELEGLMLDRAVMMSGRSMWLGGTDTAKQVECCLFNCAFTVVETVHDVVDAFWLLLNGCGVGFEVQPGCLFGFASRIGTIRIVPSERSADYRGNPHNRESYADGVWTIQVGDSARAWAKAVGKIVAGKHLGARELVLDFSDIRGPGGRLRGYGWICAGYGPLAEALMTIASIMNRAAGRMLSRGEIHDIINLLGTVLSTRRSAQIALCPIDDPDLDGFVEFKNAIEDTGAWHRYQSNNSVNGTERRGYRRDISRLLKSMFRGNRGEPGLRNASEARRRAGWSRGTNPCAEILLPNKGFCNLVEVNLAHPRFAGPARFAELCRAIEVVARANYRQTCVNLKDGILQAAWHENNQNLRLCGVGLTGISQRPDLTDGQIKIMRDMARWGADQMANELKLPHSQAVTTIKPSGTLSKIMDCTDGIHEPLGEYLLNRVAFSNSDPLVPLLRDAGFEVVSHPVSDGSVLITLPAEFPGAKTGSSAIEQLNTYLRWNNLWADHNCSCTIYYSHNEKRRIIKWFKKHWTRGVVGVSLLPRTGASYAYLPQEPVSEAVYREYVSKLKPVNLGTQGQMDDNLEAGCAGGACPIR